MGELSQKDAIIYLLGLDGESLDSLNREDCIQAQYFLQTEAISASKKFNSAKSKLDVNQILFNRAVAKHYKDYDPYLGKDLIIASICNEYDHIKSMQDVIVAATQEIKDLEITVEKLDKLSQIMKDLSFCKRKEI